MPAAEGYENLTPYTEGLCGQWRPARLDYVARASRGLGLDAGAPLRICDLACGPGLSVLLQAAAAPHLEVVGIDFNPTHIHDARRRAAEHGLGNARFFNRGIEETDDLELGEFDVITMSGAYSWLAPEIRRAARAFVRKHLKPGGFFGVHVMSQPGWGSIEPVWKLARELAAPGETDPVKRHAATMALLKGLEPSGFLKNHPVAAKRIEKIGALAPEAFAHEYLTAHWRPEYFIDIARAFAEEAGLVYVGECMRLWRNSPALSTPRWAAALLAEAADDNVRETLRDYIVLALDRHALFHKGRIPQGRATDSLTFGTLGPFGSQLSDGVAAGVGKIKLDDKRYAAVLSAVARRSLSLDAIAKDQACAGIDRKQAAEAAALLAAGDILVPFAKATSPLDVSGLASFALSPFNHGQLRRPLRPGTWVFASPVLGHGLPLNEMDTRFLETLVAGGRKGARDLLRRRYAGATMTRAGGTLQGEALLAHLYEQFAAFERDKLPKLMELEVLLPG